MSYVGETGRPLDIRIKEHKRAILVKDTAYATTNHILSSNHKINTGNPVVLQVEKEWNKRLWLEAAYIQGTPVFNANVGKRQISDAWN